ncbi:uncharacterized protein A1O9_02106 [Exophiala aquamarina CBS 119918]|uniref:Protein PBN1 n=1 Tax=Exophiala aquamarina CBS 119918 TaxID=1182545 RepID=A0A072PY49_9EURO|nr:uncharacterized protein A1O9_02106 [Exophiala aquamarina CBS 119918]KEF60545.1 hypothetical protein A1O9_02106 [Exophiala aquamarina CBS 119918]
MRRRATYITDPSLAVNPKDIQVDGRQFLLGAIKAAREERLTLGLSELPKEVVEILQESYEFHIRWAPEHLFTTVTPFLSRISPGLHLFYTPLKESQQDRLCSLIHKVFGQSLRCESPQTSFISPPLVSERFAQTASHQYYSPLPSIQGLVSYLQRNVCSPSDLTCLHSASLINIADSVDLDYDSISHALTLTAFWSKQPEVFYDPIGEFTTFDAWNIDIQSKPADKVEIGLLSPDPAQDPSELSLSGFLTVVGEDHKPKATLFSFPSRHHALGPEQSKEQKYQVSFDHPTGLHPILRISFPSSTSLVEPNNKPPGSTCALQTYLTLPSHIFADKYAFLSNDPLFQKSHRLGQLHMIAGETDLEAPDYVVEKWGSTLLLDIQAPDQASLDSGNSNSSWDVTIPLHLRYLVPQAGGLTEASLPWPIVFWACTAEEGTRFSVNPFDRTQLGFEGLFGPRTMFYHLDPFSTNSTARLVEKIEIPVLNTETASSKTIEGVTILTIVLGFLWVLWKLSPALLGRVPTSGEKAISKARKKQ